MFLAASNNTSLIVCQRSNQTQNYNNHQNCLAQHRGYAASGQLWLLLRYGASSWKQWDIKKHFHWGWWHKYEIFGISSRKSYSTKDGYFCPQVSYLWEHWTQTTSVVGFCHFHRNHHQLFFKLAGDNDRFFDQLFRCAQTVLHNGPSLARYTFQTASCFLNIDHLNFQANFSRICSHIALATRTPLQ